MIADVLRIGGRAISPYNRQPWRFKVEGQRVQVFLDRKDAGLMETEEVTWYSVGCLLENILEGARNLRYDASYRILPGRRDDEPVVELEFKPSDRPDDYDIRHILDRYTNRKRYDATPVPAEILGTIRGIFNSETASVLDVSGNYEFISVYSAVESVRAGNPKTSAELYEYIRLSRRENAAHKDKLDIRTLELPFFSEVFLRVARNRFLRSLARKAGVPRLAAQYQRNLLLHTPLVLLFVERDHRRETLVSDWMRIQRILNTLQRKGLNSHIIASSIDVLKMNRGCFDRGESRILESSRRRIEEALHEKAEDILTLLRVGYAPECKVKSLRRDLKDLLITETAGKSRS